MSKKCMISQPMNGLTDEEILAVRDKAIDTIEKSGYEFVSSFFTEKDESFIVDTTNDENIGVHYLGRSIIMMAQCKAIYFCKGWENARGCRIEHEIAKEYGYECIYEK